MDLNTQWIVGFTDGEGCFHIGINTNKNMTLGFQVLPEFTITQHKDDEKVLHAFKDYFQVGVIRKNSGNCKCYRVRGQKNLLTIIIPFFEKHKLKTRKRVDFVKFRKILLMMEESKHLTVEGLEKIREIKSTMSLRCRLRR